MTHGVLRDGFRYVEVREGQLEVGRRIESGRDVLDDGSGLSSEQNASGEEDGVSEGRR